MKAPLQLAPAILAVLPNVQGYSFYQGSSAFTGSTMTSMPKTRLSSSSITMYDSATDPPNNKDGNSMWSALASTERWIAETLSSNTGPNGDNPYRRKEVSYVCESADECAMIVGGIFRRLRESRQLGETHGATQEETLLDQGDSYSPRTMRQTQVVVLSSCQALAESFSTFDNLIQLINTARRNARDYVTDIALEKVDENLYSDEIGERDWVVSVNCAHLHPKFGEKTAQQVLEELEKEEDDGEVDVNLKAYKERREAARRSPYPTVVIEVLATPPPDYGKHPPPAAISASEDKITSEDIQRLEAIFGKSAALDHPVQQESKKSSDNDDAFYEAIGKATGIDEVSLVTPIILAQNWVSEHDDAFDVETSAFTVSDVMHVDAGYEFVFNNLAMQASKFLKNKTPGDSGVGQRQYLVMNHFLSSSATSFEKFAGQVKEIIQVLPGLANKVIVETFHPEHVDPNKRSPAPIFVLQWRS